MAIRYPEQDTAPDSLPGSIRSTGIRRIASDLQVGVGTFIRLRDDVGTSLTASPASMSGNLGPH